MVTATSQAAQFLEAHQTPYFLDAPQIYPRGLSVTV